MQIVTALRMSRVADQLRATLSELSAGHIDRRIVLELVVNLRKLIEHTNGRRAYPVTSLYCDWSLHTKIDRAGQTILERLDTILLAHLGQAHAKSGDDLIRDVTATLSLPAMRTEIELLLLANDLDTSVVTDGPRFRSICTNLLSMLCGTPITCNNKTLASLQAKRAGSDRLMIVSLSISDDMVQLKQLAEGLTFAWQLGTKWPSKIEAHPITIAGPLYI